MVFSNSMCDSLCEHGAPFIGRICSFFLPYCQPRELHVASHSRQGARCLRPTPRVYVWSLSCFAKLSSRSLTLTNNSGTLKGLLTTSSMPLSLAVAICSPRTLAVTAMIGTCPWISPSTCMRRISRAHSSPFISGICTCQLETT